MSTTRRPFPPSRILIIGAGPAGLVSLRNLSFYGTFDNVTLYERRDDVGGVWYLDDPLATSLPQDSPPSPPRWSSPAYPGLIGNVLPEYLSFSQFPFPTRADQNQPFPTIDETQEFLRTFADPFIKANKIKLNIEVTRVDELADGGWKVEVKDWNNGGEARVEGWDAVVVAVGWYDNPVWPSTPGLEILKEKGLAKHAKWYRGPQGHEGKHVLIVGNANSGNDIAAHLAPIAHTPVYQSIRRPAFPGFPSLPDDRIQMAAPVVRFELTSSTPHSPTTGASSEQITAHLEDGTTLTNLDIVHIATGYKPNPDFIHVLSPVSRNLMRLVDQNPQPETGTRVPSLHRHIIYAYNPTLAFIGSPMSYTPFTITDISSLWLALVWSFHIPLLPSSQDKLLKYEQNRLKQIHQWRTTTDNPSALFSYGVLGLGEEEYAAELRKEVVEAGCLEGVEEWFEMKWEPIEERRMWRERMFPMKFEALRHARDAKKEVKEGESTMGDSGVASSPPDPRI